MDTVDRIISAESGGNPNARNPHSSASGAGQFISSTWLDTISRHRPDLVQGRSPAEILAMRNDPQLSREMTSAYASDNAGILSKRGLPVTPGSTYLAHFAGPQGAVGILSADPNAPVAGILTPAAVKANPFLNGMTAADLRAWADRKVDGKSVPTSHHAAPSGIPSAPGMPSGTAGILPGVLSSPDNKQPTDSGLAGLLGSMTAAPNAPQMQLANMPHGQSPFPGLSQYVAEYMKTLRG